MLKSSVAGIQISCCVYNASGPRTGSVESLSKLGPTKCGIILSKSATLFKQDGNTLPRFVNKIDMGPESCQGSMNSEGLPNAGIDYYVCNETVSALLPYGKPYFVSISGLSLEDNLTMLQKAFDSEGVSAIELNLACPNVPGKPIIAYDFDQMDAVLNAVFSRFGELSKKKPVGIKLAPYFDGPHFEKAVTIISNYPVRFVVCINTIGNALMVDTESECALISPKNGFGGLGGGYVKPTALANGTHISICTILYSVYIKKKSPH